jgi:two-component system sensor histidine kinase/response regulator
MQSIAHTSLPGEIRIASVQRLLVVDDQANNVHMLGSILSRAGFEIVSATDGPQALRLFAAQPPDLVLLDALMPGMDGFEVCRRIREQPDTAGIPVIFLSAADDKDFVVRALANGAVDYVTKPFHEAELLSRVRTHLALKSARDALRQLAEDKDELLGILAHDLKSHLGGMQMSAHVLHKRAVALGEARLELMAGNILHATDQMFSFVKEFLANSRAERGLEIKGETFSLQELAADAVRLYSEAALRKQLTLHFEEGETEAFVFADRAALAQVLDNLISNAIKFSPPGRNIWITVSATTERVECRVQDEGPGFSASDHALMYGRYRRLTATPTGNEPSTGLGLSIVRRLMQAMHGELRCVSAPGQGATFIVAFVPAQPTS